MISGYKISDIFLRTVVSLLMITHGAARISHGIVDDFGVYLNEAGIRFGSIVAWGITFGEISLGLLIISGFFVRYAALFFILVLTSGLFMVHLQEGWFVVGIGRNGMEYSVLLISVFVYIAFRDFLKSYTTSG